MSKPKGTQVMAKKIYVAGPMSGIDELNKPAFDAVAKELADQGHAVMNPASLTSGFTQAQYMDVCIAMLRACDEIHLLPNWRDSEGACAEYAMATKLGMVKVYLVTEARAA